MPTYLYRARDGKGLIHSGTLEANSPSQVVELMNAAGLFVTDLKPQKSETWKELFLFRQVAFKDLAVFSRQLAVMVRAHLPIVRALEILVAQSPNFHLKEAASSLKSRVEKGKPLHEALRQHPTVFPELYVAMIEAGEQTGTLEEVLLLLAQHYEKEDAVLKKVKSASLYPLIILGFTILMVIFLLTFVLPRFAKIFTSLGANLPWPTRILLGLGNLLINSYPYLILVLLLGIGAAFMLLRTGEGKSWWDRMVLKLPVFGAIYLRLAVYRFGKILGNLVHAGIPILQALEIAANTVGNRVVAAGIMVARANIREGEPIAHPLAAAGVFPPMVTEIVAVGENTGTLDEMLHQVAEYTEGELNYTLENLTSLLEPVLILVVAGIAGFIILSIFLPIVGTWKALGAIR